MDRDGVLKVAIVGGVAVLVGYYIYKSGLWAKWTGTAAPGAQPQPSLPTAPSPTTGPTVATTTTTTAPTVVTTPAVQALTDPTDIALANSLRQLALVNATLAGTDSANIDQWNYMLHEVPGYEQAVPLDMGRIGISRDGVHDVMDAAAFVFYRKASGVAGIPAPTFASDDYLRGGYGWVN
jgi:hypothetical protein